MTYTCDECKVEIECGCGNPNTLPPCWECENHACTDAEELEPQSPLMALVRGLDAARKRPKSGLDNPRDSL